MYADVHYLKQTVLYMHIVQLSIMGVGRHLAMGIS